MQRKEVVNRYVSLILKLGTYSSVLILLLGFLLLIFFPSVKEAKPFSFPKLISGFLNLNPYAFINLGALILIFTPVLRVIVAIISFSLEKDKKYVWVSTGVLLILIGNMIFFSF
jgi:uncharacterized membrane protein